MYPPVPEIVLPIFYTVTDTRRKTVFHFLPTHIIIIGIFHSKFVTRSPSLLRTVSLDRGIFRQKEGNA